MKTKAEISVTTHYNCAKTLFNVMMKAYKRTRISATGDALVQQCFPNALSNTE